MKLSKGRMVAIATALFGVVMLWQSVQIKPLFPPTEGDCGPAVFPALCCIGMIACAIGKFLFPIVEESNKKFVEKLGWQKAGLVMLWLVLYTLGLNYLGFVLASIPAFFVLILLFTWEEKRNYLMAAVCSLVYSVGTYFLFTDVLGVLLPAGKLF